MCINNGLEARQLQLYVQCGSLALLYYDYALTFADEMEFIWRSPFSHVTILYFWCRYALVANLIFLFGYLRIGGIRCDFSSCLNFYFVSFSLFLSSCDHAYLVSGVLSILGLSGVLGLWGLRTYALYNNNKTILVLFSILGITSLVADVFHVAGNRCDGNVLFLQIVLIIRSCFDFSAAVLTGMRCYQTMLKLGSMELRTRGLTFVLLEQGILYIIAVSGFTIAATFLSFHFPECLFRRLLDAISLPLSGQMTARFILHLRKWDRKRLCIMFGSQDREQSDIEFRGCGSGTLGPPLAVVSSSEIMLNAAHSGDSRV